MKPSISLIIPVYNVEQWLGECLESVVNQSVPFQEVILINDGSSDNSIEICRLYCQKFSYFKLINQENLGLSAARNTGMRNAFGEYIMFLDSDDWLRMDSVSILIEYLSKGQPDVIYFDADTFCEIDIAADSLCSYDRSNAGIDREVMSGREFFEKTYPQNYVVSACLGIYRRAVIERLNLRFPEGVYYEDNYFTFLLLNSVQKVVHVSEKLYQRRYRSNSIMTGKYTLRSFGDYLKIVKLIWESILNEEDWGRKGLLREYISNQCEEVLEKYVFCKKHDIKPNQEVIGLLESIFYTYTQLMDNLEKCCVEKEIEEEIKVYKQLVNLEKQQLKIEFLLSEWKQKQEERLLELYREILFRIPLRTSELKVGIYGRGRHTEGLLALYEKLFGDIRCEIVFIDTYADNIFYKNKKVINYKNIDGSFHYVIVSSFLYREEMQNNIRRINETVPVISFYDTVKTDIFSIFSEVRLSKNTIQN